MVFQLWTLLSDMYFFEESDPAFEEYPQIK